jgi:hypothetical protein
MAYTNQMRGGWGEKRLTRGMAEVKYQCQGETPHSLDLFSTPLK